VCEEQNAIAGGHRLELRMAELPTCRGDEALIRQVIVNLISNARKFTRRAEHPAIEITSQAMEGKIQYTMRDNGVGFPPQHAHRLFGVFKRLHSEEEFEGTGVGLSIVQRIIQRHGGTIEAESGIGQGATFHVTLPNDGALAQDAANR